MAETGELSLDPPAQVEMSDSRTREGSGPTTTRLWASIETIYRAILDHPFIRGLTSGSLDREAFRFYVIQDALYLTEFARALAICAAKSPNDRALQMFSEHAAGAITVERELHETFFKDFGLGPEELSRIRQAPTNLAYTSYLLRVAYGGSFPEALAAVLPCYWIYWEVGKALLEEGSPDPLYTRWIQTYGGEDYGRVVEAVLRLTDEVSADLRPADEMRMMEHFQTTSRFEWMFWDMGYRKEAWPV